MNANAKTYKLGEMKDKLFPFIQSLVQSEPRFRFTDVGNEVFDDKQFFVVTKKVIYMPISMPRASHEVAHAVEMTNPKRWLLPDWGMASKPFTTEKGLTARMVFAAMAREVRVRAIELHMFPAQRNNERSWVYNLLLNEHAWGLWARQYTPFGRFKNFVDVSAWVNDLREKTYRQWSLNRIRHEWQIRLTHWQEYMETKAAKRR